jgi:Domain of unknown function (DUF4419)
MIITNPQFNANDTSELDITAVTEIDNTDFLTKIGSTNDVYYRSNTSIATSLPKLFLGKSEQIGASIVLMGTAYAGYANHNSFVLSPDILWSLITDTIAKTITLYPDRYSSLFMVGNWDGTKKELQVRNDAQTLNGEWGTSINLFRDAMAEVVPSGTVEALLPKFSTSGPMEELSNLLSFMDAGSSYYTYSVMTMCGVPMIKLLGTADDYKAIIEHLQWIQSNIKDLTGYATHLITIVSKIVDTIESGSIDDNFWGDIVKAGNRHGSGGGPYMTGWLGTFCGYVYNSRKNELKDYSGKWFNEVMTRNIGCCIPIVDFVWKCNGASKKMKFIGGVTGSTFVDGFIQPEFGYAVVNG